MEKNKIPAFRKLLYLILHSIHSWAYGSFLFFNYLLLFVDVVDICVVILKIIIGEINEMNKMKGCFANDVQSGRHDKH